MTNQPAADSTTAIEVELWGDLVSPWSWIAKRRLEKAIHAFERPADVCIVHRAFEIDPSLPTGGGVGVTEHLGAIHGEGTEAARRLTEQATLAAEDEDIWFDWDQALRANTFDAHRLVALAHEMGGLALQGAVVERLFAAHFREGLAIDDHETLQRITAEAGLDERRVAAVLAGHGYEDPVRAEERRAADLGVEEVPYALANGRRALAGTRTVEEYLDLLRRASTS